jgi:putative membrane protein
MLADYASTSINEELFMKKYAAVLAGVLITATATATNAIAQTPNDAEIASIVVTANQVDIDAGKLAQSTSTNKEVKSFAERMVIDHTGVNKTATELAAKLKVTPQDNATSRSLKARGDKNISTLKGLHGAAFDKAYVEHEVAYHQAVLDALDKTLIPNASNAELKALLVKVRPAFVSHLAHAKALLSGISKS